MAGKYQKNSHCACMQPLIELKHISKEASSHGSVGVQNSSAGCVVWLLDIFVK